MNFRKINSTHKLTIKDLFRSRAALKPFTVGIATMATAVPAGCWPTARVDGTADFTGVDRVFGYGSLVWKPPCKEEIVKKKHTAYIKGCVGGYGVLAGLHRVPEFGSRCTYTVCILFLLFHLFIF